MREIHSNLGGGIRVTVTSPRWPVLCACCCGRAGTTLKIEFDDTDDTGAVNYLASWQVPYCKACVAHVQQAESLKARTFLKPALSLGSLGALVMSWFACSYFDSWWPLAVAVGAVLGGLGYLKARGIAEGKRLMKPDCSYVGPAVWCASHKVDESGDHHTFAFNNVDYAKEFEYLNKKG